MTPEDRDKALAGAMFLAMLFLIIVPPGARLQCRSRSPQFGIRCERPRKHRNEHYGEGFHWRQGL
jgi:hypothetical protein